MASQNDTIDYQQLGADYAMERADQLFAQCSYWDALCVGIQRLDGNEAGATLFAEGYADQLVCMGQLDAIDAIDADSFEPVEPVDPDAFRSGLLSHNDNVKAHVDALALMGKQGMQVTPELRAYVKACHDRVTQSGKEVDELLDLL